MVLVCCVCHRVRKGGEWIEEPVPAGELPSHGYCPDCAAIARVELELMRLRQSQEELWEGLRESAVA